MIEKKIYAEIPGGRDRFHSAVLTSFSFDFHHFEFQVLKTLRGKWIGNIAVMADQRKLDEVMGCLSGGLKDISRTYSVNGVKAKGAFHPKINFFIGDNSLLMLFGSGNITPGGHGKNHELFTGFIADSNNVEQLPILLEAWEYIKRLAEDIKGYSSERLLKLIPENCTLLQGQLEEQHRFCNIDNNFDVALLYNTSKSYIFKQLIDKIPADDIEEISIISPYYDEDGELISELANYFGRANIRVFLAEKFGLPPVEFPGMKQVQFYSWETTRRARQKLKNQRDFTRKLHSKFIRFQGKSLDYLLLGSANATTFGMGTLSKKPINEEFCALYRTKDIDWLKEFGVHGKLKKASLIEYTRDNNLETGIDEGKKSKIPQKINITSADLSGETLSVFLYKAASLQNEYLCLHDDYGSQIASISINGHLKDGKIILRINNEVKERSPLYLLITNADNTPISNKQVINYTDKLISTIPSHANRNIQKILYSLEANKINEFKILEYLNELEKGKQDSHKKSKDAVAERSVSENRSEFDSAEFSYVDALKVLKSKDHKTSIINSYHTVRFWEMINRIFYEKHQDNQNSIMDEEEEANAEVSRERSKVEKPESEEKMDLKDTINKMGILTKNYCISIQKVINLEQHNPGIIDFTKFLLITHVLTAIAFFVQFKSKNIDQEKDTRKNLKDAWKENTLRIIKKFTQLLIKHSYCDKEDELYLLKKKEHLRADTINRLVLFGAILRDYCTIEEKVIEEEIDLIMFNAFKALGGPDERFEKFIADLSIYEGGFVLNPGRIIKGKNIFVQKYEQIPDEKYVYLYHSGFCRVLDIYGNRIKYRSVFGISTTHTSKLKV